MFRGTIVAMAALLPATAWAQKQEIRDLQREVAELTEMVRTLQRSSDERHGEVRGLLTQAVELGNKSSTSVSMLGGQVKEQLTAPMANVNSRIDQVTTEMQAVRESVIDLTSRIGKLQQQLEDLSNTIKVLQAPPAPPPTTGAPTSGAPGAAASGPPPGMSARQLYEAANRDRSGGQLDLALQGYQQYLQYYGTTELAPNAQFYIGQIHYDRGEFPQALAAFDRVLEGYSDNNKTPDALYMKGMTLLRSNQRNEAAREFLNVIQKYPQSEVAEKARSQRKQLGLSVPASGAAKARRRR